MNAIDYEEIRRKANLRIRHRHKAEIGKMKAKLARKLMFLPAKRLIEIVEDNIQTRPCKKTRNETPPAKRGTTTNRKPDGTNSNHLTK